MNAVDAREIEKYRRRAMSYETYGEIWKHREMVAKEERRLRLVCALINCSPLEVVEEKHAYANALVQLADAVIAKLDETP